MRAYLRLGLAIGLALTFFLASSCSVAALAVAVELEAPIAQEGTGAQDSPLDKPIPPPDPIQTGTLQAPAPLDAGEDAGSQAPDGSDDDGGDGPDDTTSGLSPLQGIIETVTSLESWLLGLLGGVLFALLALPVFFLLRRSKRRPASPQAAPATDSGLPRLVAAATSAKPLVLSLDPEGLLIGRGDDNGGVVTRDYPGYETVSQTHARVYYEKGRWKIQDLQSTNGIYVNDARTGHNTLQDGWQVRLGRVEFVFYAGTTEAQA